MTREIFGKLEGFGLGLSKAAPVAGTLIGAGFLCKSFSWLDPFKRR